MPRSIVRCSHCGDTVLLAAHGLCTACYVRLRRTGSLARKNIRRAGKCAYGECSEPVMAKGLCSLHYSRQQHPLYATWKNLRSRWGGQVCQRWGDGFGFFLNDVGERPSPRHMLRRKDSKLPFDRDNVHWTVPEPPSKTDSYTVDERSAYARSWMLKARYGLTPEAHQKLLADQNFVCAVCKSDELFVNSRTGRKQELSVDHCHETDRVRGLLCVGCNRGLGYFKDNKDTLRAAIAYLEKHETKEASDG